jgi:uncharacterized protein YyaL (SSP411 family)
MKKYSYILMCAAFLAFSFTTPEDDKKKDNAKEAEVKWYNWNEGYPIALKSNKIVLVDLYTSWCGWCKRMDKDTYTNEEVAEYINKKFVPIKLNPEADGKYKIDSMSVTGAQLMGMLTNNQSTGYPTIVFIYPNKSIELYPGYQDAPGFKTTLNKVFESKNNKKAKK